MRQNCVKYMGKLRLINCWNCKNVSNDWTEVWGKMQFKYTGETVAHMCNVLGWSRQRCRKVAQEGSK